MQIATVAAVAMGAALTKDVAVGIAASFAPMARMITNLVTMSKSYYGVATSVAASTAAHVAHAATGIGTTLIAVAKAIPQLTLYAWWYSQLAIQAVKSAAIQAAAWLTTIVPTTIASIGAILTASAPLLLGIAAIALAIGAVAVAWANNWGDIQGITGRVLGWIGDRIADFLNLLAQIPGVGDHIKGAISAVQGFAAGVAPTIKAAGDGLGSFINQFQQGFPGLQAEVDKLTQGFGKMTIGMGDMREQLEKVNSTGNQTASTFDNIGEAAGNAAKTAKDAAESMNKAVKLAIDQMVGQLKGGMVLTGEELEQELSDLTDSARTKFFAMTGYVSSHIDALKELEDAYKQLQGTQAEIDRSEDRMAGIRLEMERQDLLIQQQQQVNAGVLLEYQRQSLQLDQQITPIKAQLADVENRAQLAQRTNLDTERQILSVNQSMLPLKRSLDDVEQRIKDAQRGSVDLERQRLQLVQQMLPMQQQLAAIQDRMSGVGRDTQHLDLQKDLLLAQQQQLPLQYQLQDAQDALQAAQNTGNAEMVGTLTDQIALLEQQLDPINRQITLLERQQEMIRIADDLTTNALDHEKLAIENSLKPLQDKLTAIQNEQAAEKARADLVVFDLEQEKAGLEAQLKPLQDKLNLLQQQQEAEKLRIQETLLDLEEEKRKLEDQLAPLQAQKDGIDQATSSIKTQQEIDAIAYEMAKSNLQSKMIDEQLWNNAQQTTLDLQEKQFASMVTGFQSAMVASGAFTADEAQQFLERMDYWKGETKKLSELYASVESVKTMAEDTKAALDAIPKDITVTIHQSTESAVAGSDNWNNRNDWDGTDYNAMRAAGVPGFATGGLVMSPTLATVGEVPEAIIPLSKLAYIPAMRDLYGQREQTGSQRKRGADAPLVGQLIVQAPTPLSPSQVRRQTEKGLRSLALEYELS